MKRLLCALLFVVSPLQLSHADDWTLRGRVVDSAGEPVRGADVDWFWRANGKRSNSDGAPYNLEDPEELRLCWGSEGQMEPFRQIVTSNDGHFEATIPSHSHAVMVLDATRKLGAIARIAVGDEDKLVEIRLEPLTRVHATVELSSTRDKPFWCNAYVHVPSDPLRPIDSPRIASCASMQGRFECLLPPGEYTLDAYGESNEGAGIDINVRPEPAFTVTGNNDELDLGKLTMTPRPPSLITTKIAQAKKAGRWGDYSKHYGQPPPPWNIVDARGALKDAQLVDYRGKWVLLYFWGTPCRHCLAAGLPELMTFYEEHASQRDQFEVLAFCIDCDNELKSIADLDRALAPVVQNVWHGKTLPFPLLLDPSFTTMERDGMRAYGTLLLIDPDGNLIEGDAQTLAAKLKK